MSYTPSSFIRKSIETHEGKLSLNPKDNGNWFDPVRMAKGQPQKRNLGKLIGSQYGVTAYALAAHKKLLNVTAEDIRNVTLDLATEIGVKSYYLAPKLDLLPWDRVTMAVIDTAWMSGAKRAVQILQRTIGVEPDGQMGPKTVQSYKSFLAIHGEAGVANLYADVRIQFYVGLGQPEFLDGWKNRANSFRPKTAWWNSV